MRYLISTAAAANSRLCRQNSVDKGNQRSDEAETEKGDRNDPDSFL
jgi:hypothetical protein